jgi:hypothetical protein
MVRDPAWEPYRWTGLEVKNARGRPTPEQREFAAGDHIAIVRTLEAAMDAVRGAVRG